MRCKKHLPDLSSTIGVCASCLRERLEAIVEAQAQAQAHAHQARVASSDDHHHHRRKPEPNPPPLNFPRSVSPYVSRRKSDCAALHGHDHRFERLFHSTPQVGPTFSTTSCEGKTASLKKNRLVGKFWNLTNPFRFRSHKHESSSHESCGPSSSSASPSWFSMILQPRRQSHHDANGSIDGSTVTRRRFRYRKSDRGMSPAGTENFTDEFDGRDGSPSGSGYLSESSPRRSHQTPTVVPAVAPQSVRRSRLGPGKSVSGLAFCLSPLVRASPNRHYGNHKGLVQELGVGGAHHISTAASFCANRSRKLADFGRVNYNNNNR